MEDFVGAVAIASKTEMIGQRGNSKWRTVGLPKMFAISRLEMLHNFGGDVYHLPVGTLFRVCFRVRWDFQTYDAT